METDEFDPILDLGEVAETLGISHLATVHMYEMSVMNETLIIEDLRKGLLFEWLIFINLHLRDHPHDFEQAIMKLFIDDLGDNIRIDLGTEELDKMLDDRSYAGSIIIVQLDDSGRIFETVSIELTLNQYLNFLELGAKS